MTSRTRVRRRAGLSASPATAVAVGVVLALAGCGAEPASATSGIELRAAEIELEGVVARGPVRVTAGLEAWSRSVASGGPDHTECAPLDELPGAHACATATTAAMNRALLRASIYAEGAYGAAPRTVVAETDAAYRMGSRKAEGHDLRAESLVAFWLAAETACETKGAAFCATDAERALFEGYVLPRIAGGHLRVLVGFAAEGARELVVHEVLHAQFFLDATYREAAETFFRDVVTADDKVRVLERLAPVYDVTDDTLVTNEFMAYVLMPEAEFHMLAPVVPTYRPRFTTWLASRGVRPLAVR